MHDFSTIDTRRSTLGRAFSLVELLVVIGIIALLAGILFPTIGKVRIAGQEADSKSVLNQIDQACQAYFTDFKAYPGPFSNTDLQIALQPAVRDGSAAGTTFNAGAATDGAVAGSRITGAENLVLGLCGGLAVDRPTGLYYFDKSAVGQGPAGFNPLRPNRATSYLQTANLSTGRLMDVRNAAIPDSIIPEFMDRFTSPMPFLYLRSRGTGISTATVQNLVSSQVATPGNAATLTPDYNLIEVLAYTGGALGESRVINEDDYQVLTPAKDPLGPTTPHGLRTANNTRTIVKGTPGYTYAYPYDAYDYLVDPSSYDHAVAPATAAPNKRVRKKDSYVLISPGKDRVYGTADDLTSFGSVLP